MNDEITHTDDVAPRSLFMCITKFFCEQICSFSNYNQLIHNCKITDFIFKNLRRLIALCKLIDIIHTF